MLRLQTIYTNTPTLAVFDPRGMVARAVQYDCAAVAGAAQTRVNCTVHDAAGRAIELWDPRLFVIASGPSNLSNMYSLAGAILASTSVDAGLRISLFGEAGQPVQGWDGRGSLRWMRYDGQSRLSELFEQTAGGDSVCAERLTYAANDQAFANHNQCGRLIRHEDPAGVLLFNDYGLNGAALEQERRLASQKTDGYITHSRFNPSGELISVTDARGNQQRVHQTPNGSSQAVDLRLNDSPEWLPIVRAVAYNAHGQVEQEVAGNGVITTLEYDPEDGRLKRLLSPLGTDAPLQDLHYTYDPVGNVLSIKDAALPIRFFANQRVEPISHYRYDTLYRLIEATGWEAGAMNHGPSASPSADPAMPANYRQTYRYDAGNNLLELTHVGAQDPGHRLVAEAHSNRCLPVRNGVEPSEQDFQNSFDANGNLLKLQPGQTLSWDVRNQLREVRPVERSGADDDIERYEYGADGMRVRKIRSLQTGSQTNVIETRYLPGLQIRTHSGTGEELHIIEVSTGRGSVRVLHWKSEPPTGIPNNQQRYSLTDHLGSSTLELDEDTNVITQERYYPFGGTAWSSGEAVQVSYKTMRYSGKERDATSLYYYGFRYYAPWLQRWLNPDPAGNVDGLNMFAFVGGNPLSYEDIQGMQRVDISKPTPRQRKITGLNGDQIKPTKKMDKANIPWRNENEPYPVVTTYNVDEKVMDRLVLADAANRFSKVLLPFGSNNQVLEKWRTRGKSHDQLGQARQGTTFSLPRALLAGAGNCGEFAHINFSLLANASSRRDPIQRVSAHGEDHAFVVIGDYRERGAVYADAWATFPLAHPASHGAYTVGEVLEEMGPGSSSQAHIVDDWYLERSRGLEFPVKSGYESDNAELVNQLKRGRDAGTMHLEWFSRSNAFILAKYRSPTRSMTSKLSASYVKDRIGHAKELQKKW